MKDEGTQGQGMDSPEAGDRQREREGIADQATRLLSARDLARAGVGGFHPIPPPSSEEQADKTVILSAISARGRAPQPAPAEHRPSQDIRFAASHRSYGHQEHASDLPVASSEPASAALANGSLQEAIDQLARLERKINRLRSAVNTLLVSLFLLVGLALYQSQQLDKNRQALVDMQAGAQSQIMALAPQLKTKLDALDARLDGVDGKMQQAEDRFAERMKVELPQIMDDYKAKQLKELDAQGLTARARQAVPLIQSEIKH